MKKLQSYLRFFKTFIAIIIASFLFFSVNAKIPKKNAAPCILPGTYSLGPTGDYSSITQINRLLDSCGLTGAYTFEFQNTYSSAVETFPITFPPFFGSGASKTVTFRPSAGANTSITSNNVGATIDLNGAKNIIFDGRPSGASSGTNLTITNTNSGGMALRFINDAINIQVKYCILRGESSSFNRGVVMFSTGLVTGNDDNTISYCNITSDGIALPITAIYAEGSTSSNTINNSGNSIYACNIFDYFSPLSISTGVKIDVGNTAWSITDNNFYQTAARVFTAVDVELVGIMINNKATGINFNISGNYIGGSSPMVTGTPLTISGTGVFNGIKLFGGAGGTNFVGNNVIANISITTTSLNINTAIFHSDGAANISKNTVGSLTTRSTIVLNSGALKAGTQQPNFSGIFVGGSPAIATEGGDVLVSNNKIGGIDLLQIGNVGDLEFRGIDAEGLLCKVTVSGNTIGGTIANSITNYGNNNTSGIVGIAGLLGVTHAISNNTVQNIFASFNTGSANTGLVQGISVQGTLNFVKYDINNNTIKNLSTNRNNYLVGISNYGMRDGQNISSNTIYNLYSSGTNTLTARVYGMNIISNSASPLSGNNTVTKNIIRNLYNAGTNVASGLIGMYVNGGTTNYENNMISLGYKADGTDYPNGTQMMAIFEQSGENNFYYNTLHIGGTVVTGSNLSWTFYSNNNARRNVKNNIFSNARSNTRALGFAFYITNPANLVSDYNYFTSTGVKGKIVSLGGTIYNSIDTAFYSTTLDDNSVTGPALKFVNPVFDLRLLPSPDPANFYVNNEADPLVPVSTDIDGKPRNSRTPDPGCFEFIGTGSWIGLTDSRWELAGNAGAGGNWEDGIVPTSTLNAKAWRAPNMPVINAASGVQSVQDLCQKIPSIVTVNNSTLQIKGIVYPKRTMASFIDARNGTIEMIGSGITPNQILAPRWFANNTISTLINSTATSLTIAPPTTGDTMLISTTLKYGTSTAGSNIITNDNLTLLSKFTGTANFGNATGNSITGKVNIERYLFSKSAWRLLATPVQTGSSPTIKESWRESNSALGSATGYGTRVTGPIGPYFAAGAATSLLDEYTIRASMKSYDASNNTYTNVTNANTSSIANNTGYFVFVRGDRANATLVGVEGITNLRIKGNVRTGDQIFTIPAKAGTAPGFQSIGNPYPSRVLMSSISKSATTVNAFTVWNPTLAGLWNVGGYETYTWDGTNYTKPGGATRNYIESGEAFFMQNNSTTAAATVTFKETDKGTGYANVSRPGVTIPTLEINMYSNDANGNPYLADGVKLNYNNNFSAGIDNLDVRKLNNTYDNISIRCSNVNLIVERRPNIVATDTLQLNIQGMRVANYRLEIDPSVLNYPTLEATFVDKYLNTRTPVSFAAITNISFDITTDAASRVIDRFMIVYAEVSTTAFENIAAVRNVNKTVKVTWAVQNEIGVANYTIEHSNDGVNFTAISTKNATANNGTNTSYSFIDLNATTNKNWYRVKVNIGTTVARYTSIAMVNELLIPTATAAVATMGIYPNPVVGGIVNLKLYNQPAGEYSVVITNTSGQIINKTKIKVQTNAVAQTINIGAASAGIYYATIMNAEGKKVAMAFIVK